MLLHSRIISARTNRVENKFYEIIRGERERERERKPIHSKGSSASESSTPYPQNHPQSRQKPELEAEAKIPSENNHQQKQAEVAKTIFSYDHSVTAEVSLQMNQNRIKSKRKGIRPQQKARVPTALNTSRDLNSEKRNETDCWKMKSLNTNDISVTAFKQRNVSRRWDVNRQREGGRAPRAKGRRRGFS